MIISYTSIGSKVEFSVPKSVFHSLIWVSQLNLSICKYSSTALFFEDVNVYISGNLVMSKLGREREL